MKIGIIGNGFVGRATQLFTRGRSAPLGLTLRSMAGKCGARSANGESVESISGPISTVNPSWGGGTPLIYDIRPEACDPPGITLEDLDRECDLLFFCLPTPLHHDGSCYTQILEDTIAKCPTNPYKIIRSTIPVSFAAKHECYFMPEFLTEANWEDDFRRTSEWVVGIPARVDDDDEGARDTRYDARDAEFKRRIQALITESRENGAIDSDRVTFTTTNEAETLKLMKNCFLSAKVGLMNEFYDFCAATGTDYDTVVALAKRDARMGASHFQVPGPDGRRGFGGTCFPKDTHSLYCQMTAHRLTPRIYPAILARNDTVDRPERDWSRDVWRTTIPLPTQASNVVVVFTDTEATTASASAYLRDIIRTNLAKNNVVIEVVRGSGDDSGNGCDASQTTHKNHLVQYHHANHSSAPLFFPRVDECYYTPQSGADAYTIMCEVMRVIDLWANHEQMTLYVVKQRRMDTCDGASESESGTEGFDSDGEDEGEDDKKETREVDYAKVIEDYYQTKYGDTRYDKRRLVVMF